MKLKLKLHEKELLRAIFEKTNGLLTLTILDTIQKGRKAGGIIMPDGTVHYTILDFLSYLHENGYIKTPTYRPAPFPDIIGIVGENKSGPVIIEREFVISSRLYEEMIEAEQEERKSARPLSELLAEDEQR